MREIVEKLNALQMRLDDFGRLPKQYPNADFDSEFARIESDIQNFYHSWQELNNDIKNNIKDLKSKSGAHTLEDYLLHIFSSSCAEMSSDDCDRVTKSGIPDGYGIFYIGRMIKDVMDNHPNIFFPTLSVATVVAEPKPEAERLRAQLRFYKPVPQDPSITDDLRTRIAQMSSDEIKKYRLVDRNGVAELVSIDADEAEIPAVSSFRNPS